MRLDLGFRAVGKVMKSLENSKVACWVGAKGVVMLVFLDEDLHNHQCYYWKWVDEERIPTHDGSKQQDSCSLLGFPRFTVQAFLLSDNQPFCMDKNNLLCGDYYPAVQTLVCHHDALKRKTLQIGKLNWRIHNFLLH